MKCTILCQVAYATLIWLIHSHVLYALSLLQFIRLRDQVQEMEPLGIQIIRHLWSDRT